MLPSNHNFILEEYKAAVQLTFHIDSLRNKLSSIYLTFCGLITGVLAIIIKGEYKSSIITQSELIVFLSLFVAIIGLIKILILGRLRKVQFENFNIINNIRTFYLNRTPLQKRQELKDTFLLNTSTLPKERLWSGSFLWVLIIIFSSSTILAFGVSNSWFKEYSIIIPLVYLIICIIFYFLLCAHNYKSTAISDK